MTMSCDQNDDDVFYSLGVSNGVTGVGVSQLIWGDMG
jgi:hypothetical protein